MPFNEVSFGLQESDVVGLTPDQRTAIEFQLCVSIFNEGPQKYKNFRYPRYRNFYGYAQIMSGVHVVKKVALRYLNQEILHFRDVAFGVNDTTGCYFKAFGAASSPPIVVVPNTVKTRQRYTSVRFRFVPGVLGNCSIAWETAQSACNSNILEPANEQGQPPAGNNGGYNPGARPGGQGGDGEDPSSNDGNYDPASGLPEPPKPGRSDGQWHAVLLSLYPNCSSYTNDVALTGANDSRIVPVYVIDKVNPGCGGISTDGYIFYGNTNVAGPTGVLTCDFYYV